MWLSNMRLTALGAICNSNEVNLKNKLSSSFILNPSLGALENQGAFVDGDETIDAFDITVGVIHG